MGFGPYRAFLIPSAFYTVTLNNASDYQANGLGLGLGLAG